METGWKPPWGMREKVTKSLASGPACSRILKGVPQIPAPRPTSLPVLRRLLSLQLLPPWHGVGGRPLWARSLLPAVQKDTFHFQPFHEAWNRASLAGTEGRMRIPEPIRLGRGAGEL